MFIAVGLHVWMPDTLEHRAVYPQPMVQQPGIGFPLARVAVLFSLATGSCHDMAIAPYAGKGTGETTLLSDRSGQSPLLSEPQRYFFALAFSRAAASARTDSGSSLNRSRQPEQQTQ